MNRTTSNEFLLDQAVAPACTKRPGLGIAAVPKPPPTVTPTIPPISVPLNYQPVHPSIDPRNTHIVPIRPPITPHPRPPMVPPPNQQ